MQNIQGTINGNTYYFNIGFMSVSNISALADDPSVFAGEQVVDSGLLALRVLECTGKEYHPDINWREFLDNLPPGSYKEVWDIVERISDAVLEIQEQNNPGIEVGSDAWMAAQGG